MKVAICHPTTSSASRTRGVGAYTRELTEALIRLYPADQFVATSTNPYQSGVDIVHYPYFDPFFLTLPRWQPLPTVVTIHDAIPLKYPTHFPPGIKGKFKWQLQRLAARRAKHIITDSLASQSDLIHYLEPHQDKISVIPLAPATHRASTAIEAKVKKTYGLPARYLLYVGDINWNKNVPGLIKMFGQLSSPSLHLLLVGKVFADKPAVQEYHAVEEAIAKSPASSRIHTLGYVPSHHLPVLYRLATLYVQPSFDEGFGLTLLEAMKERCPVATSSLGSLPEVGGQAVAYFDPHKPESMVSVIGDLVASPTKRAALAKLGAKRVKEFSWNKTAALTMEVYAKVLS